MCSLYKIYSKERENNMAVRDFHTWAKDTNKQLPEVTPIKEGSARRAGVRKHAYPPIYNRGNYPDQDAVTHAADANFYLHQSGK